MLTISSLPNTLLICQGVKYDIIIDMKIKQIWAEEILDSRGNPTISTKVILENNSIGWANVPSGASTGKHEAVELRDNDANRYGGLGVLKAKDNVNNLIAKVIVGKEVDQQKEIDQVMIDLDGNENKSKLGANAILSVSLAVARAGANAENLPLYQYLSRFDPAHQGKFIMPVPQMNIMNGGKHANWATDIQEFMIFPVGANSIQKAVEMGVSVYQNLKIILKQQGYSINVGDEGGFAPLVKNNSEPFQLISQAVEKAGYKLGQDIVLGIDAAASEFYSEKKYNLKKENKNLSNKELIDFYLEMKSRYPIVSFEDIFDQDDWEGFQMITEKIGKSTQIVGDDLYVTNVKRLQRGINEKTTNSILIKLNQIGTLTETIDAILLARQAGMTAIVSHRSGETEDAFMADFVVAMGTGQIKAGAPCRSERVAKYNRLMMIERELREKAEYSKFPFSQT